MIASPKLSPIAEANVREAWLPLPNDDDRLTIWRNQTPAVDDDDELLEDDMDETEDDDEMLEEPLEISFEELEEDELEEDEEDFADFDDEEEDDELLEDDDDLFWDDEDLEGRRRGGGRRGKQLTSVAKHPDPRLGHIAVRHPQPWPADAARQRQPCVGLAGQAFTARQPPFLPPRLGNKEGALPYYS